MALFPKPTPKPNPNAAYALPGAVLEASAMLTAALDGRAQLDAAIQKNAIARQAADQRRHSAAAEVEKTDLALALEIDGAKITVLEVALDASRLASQEAVTAFDRATRLQSALYAKAPELDAAVTVAQQFFQGQIGSYCLAINTALAAEAQQAAAALVRVLHRAHATAAAVGNLSQSGGFLGETLIPSPAPSQPAIVGNGQADGPDGSRIDLASTWQTDPTAVALADTLRPLTDLRRRLASHRPFSPPPPPAKLYDVGQANRSAAEYNRAVDEREAARNAAAPKAPSWSGQARSVEYSATSSMPRV